MNQASDSSTDPKTQAEFDAILAQFDVAQDNSTQKTKRCPICGNSVVVYDERFTNTVCKDCEQRAVDTNGHRIAFYNSDMDGGLIAEHTLPDGNKTTDNNVDCTIDGKACRGVEFHLGGTGIELIV